MFNKMKMSEKIRYMVIFVSMFSIMAVAIMSAITIRHIAVQADRVNKELVDGAMAGARGALLEQAYSFLDTIAEEQRVAVDAALENIIKNVTIIEGAVKAIYKNPESHNGYRVRHMNDLSEDFYESTWIIPEGAEVTPEIDREINLLSNLNMLLPTLAEDPNVEFLFVGTENGVFFNYSAVPTHINDPDFDPRKRPWYKKAMDNPGETVFTDPYPNAFDDALVITAAKTILDHNGELIGVVGVDVRLNALQELILSTRIARTGYVFLMDKSGIFIVHPDLEGKNVGELQQMNDNPFYEGYRRMMDGESGFVRVVNRGESLYMTFSPLSYADWSVGAVMPESETLFARDKLFREMKEISDKATTANGNAVNRALWMFSGVFVLCMLMALVIGIYLARIISTPIKRLAEGVSAFGEGDLQNRLTVETSDEIGYLSEVFNQMADNIIKNMEDLARNTAEQERLNSELRIAVKIQNDMLPDVNASFGGHGYVSVYAMIKPALEMGGDLYDVFFADKECNKLCTVIADVSGKGIPAAMFMIIAKTLIRDYILAGDSPAQALKKINNRLCEDNPDSMFVTAFIGLTDMINGKWEYSSAGHNPMVYCPKNERFSFVDTGRSMPLGLFPGNEYQLYQNVVAEGDKIFYYTDGVTEALNENDQQWGEDNLINSLNQVSGSSCGDIASHVWESIAVHVDEAKQSDDITILVVEFMSLYTERCDDYEK